MSLSFTQYSNAVVPIVSTFERLMSVSSEHAANALSGTDLTFGMMAVMSDAQLQNVLVPIFVHAGSAIDVMAVL